MSMKSSVLDIGSLAATLSAARQASDLPASEIGHAETLATLQGDESIQALMAPVRTLIERYPNANEICMSAPGVFHVAAAGVWHEVEVPEMHAGRCLRLAEAVSYFVRQEIKEESPLLSTTLPTGERVQIAIPPACDSEQIVLSIRIPSTHVRPLSAYDDEGCFAHYRWVESAATERRWTQLSPSDQALIECLQERHLAAFLLQAVQSKKNIAVVGDTGSGKTTLMKALCLEIPAHERLITIEDARELVLPQHRNKVHLLYAKGGQAARRVSPAELIAACMRLFPDRVLLAELRGSEAFDFLKLMTTGHSGSITSFHAESCALALDRWVFMAKEHSDAASASASDIKRLIALTVDVFVHIAARPRVNAEGQVCGVDRVVTEVAFDPAGKLELHIGQGVLHE